MGGDRIFLDTNILIYAYDVSAGEKHAKARQIVEDLWGSALGVLSTQVLQELYVNVTKKSPRPLDIKTAREIVADLLKWDVIVNDGESILEAIEIQAHYRLSFWDSMIVASAVKGGVALLLSEDLSDGQVINGVTIRNPFGQMPYKRG